MSTLRHRHQARLSHTVSPGATGAAAPDVTIGHNGGPPIQDAVNNGFVRWRWRQAHKEAWRNPPMSILRFRVARAKAAGVTYREYMLALLDTGRHLQAEDVARLRDKTARPTRP
jgi:hypothetical protein